MSDRIARIVSIVSAACLALGLVWGYGYLVGKGRAWPARQIDELSWFARSFLRYGAFVPRNRLQPAPAGASRERVAVHEPDAAIGEGHYAILGWDDATDGYGVWLHDAAGAPVHFWDYDESAFSHEPSAPHAMAVLSDGSLILSFDVGGGMVRIDACGESLWTREGSYHHAFSRAEDGGIWTWFGEKIAYGQYQYVVKFDPETGQTLERIGLVEDIIGRSPESAVLFSMRPDTRFVPDDREPRDLFHPNDVEELPASMAGAFPMFEAGDLLISIRNLDMVAVIDREGRVRWSRYGPWRMQHDPDFQPDGTISVFNNNRGRPRSDITIVDPATGAVQGLFAAWQVPFFTERRGKHQILPNGNVLLTIPEQGQALEATPDGTVAVEFNNVAASPEGYNNDLPNAQWLPPDFFETMPACAG